MTRTLSFLIGCVAIGQVASAAELAFRASATPSGAVVTLGDVAQVSAANPGEAASLAGVALFPAPVQAKTVYVEEILETLELRGVATGELTATGSRVISVGPASTNVVARPTAYSVAHGLPASSPSSLASKVATSAPVVARVVAIRDLARDQIVRAEDVAVEPPSATVTTAGIVGGQLLSAVRAGHSITPAHVAAVKLVHRGDAVEASVAYGAVTVTARGIAEHDAAIGERVAIRTLDRKRLFDGVVTGPRAVRVGGDSR